MRAPSPRDYRRYSDIEAAIRRLPIRHEEEWRVRHIADYLAIMGLLIAENGGDGTVPPHFRPANARMVKEELEVLGKRANDLASRIERRGNATRARKQLARHIQYLHGPTMTALSDAPPVMVGSQQILADICYFRSELPKKLEEGEEITSGELRFLAKAAKLAMSGSPKVQNVGRLPDKRAHTVANTLGRDYFDLTGNEPTFTTAVAGARQPAGTVYGQFLDFVREIFQVLNIRRDALSHASAAAYRLRGRGRQK